jgi:hypothetical protein
MDPQLMHDVATPGNVMLAVARNMVPTDEQAGISGKKNAFQNALPDAAQFVKGMFSMPMTAAGDLANFGTGEPSVVAQGFGANRQGSFTGSGSLFQRVDNAIQQARGGNMRGLQVLGGELRDFANAHPVTTVATITGQAKRD